MKLTKAKLKQMIKEELCAIVEHVSEDLPAPWTEELESFMQEAADFYDSLPVDGKERMTSNFLEYAQKWEEEVATVPSPPEEKSRFDPMMLGVRMEEELEPGAPCVDHPHPGQTCMQAHPNITHQQYEEGRTASLKLTIK